MNSNLNDMKINLEAIHTLLSSLDDYIDGWDSHEAQPSELLAALNAREFLLGDSLHLSNAIAKIERTPLEISKGNRS